MNEIEPGHYYFRAVGLDAAGDTAACYSQVYYLRHIADRQLHRDKFLKQLTDAGYTKIEITHCMRETGAHTHYAQY